MKTATKSRPSVHLALTRASFAILLDCWPDLAVIARDLGCSYFTVVAWKRRDGVPEAHWQALADSASARGLRGITYTKCRQIEAERRRRRPDKLLTSRLREPDQPGRTE